MAGALSAGLALLCAACSSEVYVEQVTPWFRERSYVHRNLWDSGVLVTSEVQLRRGRGWKTLRGASRGTVMESPQRVAFRTAQGGIAIARDDDGAPPVPVPGCDRQQAWLSPDRRRVVCFPVGTRFIGFVGDTLYASEQIDGFKQDGRWVERCRLLAVGPDGKPKSASEALVQYPPDECSSKRWWQSFFAGDRLVQGVPVYRDEYALSEVFR